MYVIELVTSTVLRIMMPPHERNILNIDQLMYYDPKGLACMNHVLLMVEDKFVSLSIQ